MRKYIVESTSTFFIALALGISANYIAIGIIISCFTLVCFPISGAHFNPAITFALLIQKRIRLTEAVYYVIAQFLGVVSAVILFYFLIGRTYVLMPQQNIHILKPLLIEIILTFFIVLMYLKMFASFLADELQFSKYWFVTGLSVMAAGLSGAAISGGAYNPALGLAPALVELVVKSGYPLGHCWIYALGPLIGATAAAIMDKYVLKNF